MSDARGVYEKFRVERTDGDPTGKHKDCCYFVLDVEHDEGAIPALKAYAKAHAKTRPQLAKDIRWILRTKTPNWAMKEKLTRAKESPR